MRIVVGFVCAVVLLAGCSADEKPATPTTSAAGDDTGIDAQESSEPVTRLVLVEPETGATVVFDAGEATETRLGELGPTHGVSGDGRFAYLRGDDALAVVDADRGPSTTVTTRTTTSNLPRSQGGSTAGSLPRTANATLPRRSARTAPLWYWIEKRWGNTKSSRSIGSVNCVTSGRRHRSARTWSW